MLALLALLILFSPAIVALGVLAVAERDCDQASRFVRHRGRLRRRSSVEREQAARARAFQALPAAQEAPARPSVPALRQAA